VRALVVSLEPAVGAVAGRGSVPELAAALRDFVHRRVPLKMSPPGVAFLPLYAAFRAAVLDPGVGHVCGGLAATYMTALEAFGIPARYVGMHTRAAVGADSHVSVEYLDRGRWIASDPTFDVTFRDVTDGRPLSWLETRARLLAGRPVHVSTDGFRVARARRLESYYLPLATLLRYVVVYDDRDANGLLEPGEMIREPADWDGTLEEVNGERWRHSPSGVWVVLQSRPS
jgi:transglutaminase-like putative cysteine protease